MHVLHRIMELRQICQLIIEILLKFVSSPLLVLFEVFGYRFLRVHVQMKDRRGCLSHPGIANLHARELVACTI